MLSTELIRIDETMKTKSMMIQNESGNTTMLAMMVLGLLTLIGISGVRIANIEKRSATNENLHKITFFAGEAARAYVMGKPDLYGDQNIVPGNAHFFPNPTYDPYVANTDGSGITPWDMGSGQSFSGTVEYNNGITPPRESGFDTSSYRAHTYTMECHGEGQRNVEKEIDAGFYRIGL
jgi:hypothetical protein